VDKVKKLWCYKRLVKKTLLQVLSLYVLLNFRYSSKYFAQIYRARYGAAMLMHLCRTPTWRPENSANIWNLLCLSRQLIICAEQTSIYISTFPNTLTSEWAKNHEISIYFFTNAFVALCHAPPWLWNSKCAGFQTKQATELKVVNRCELTPSYAWWA